MMETGARPGEVRRVTAAHVNLDLGVWVFQEHKFEVTCGTTLPLAPYDQADNFVVPYTGQVLRVEDGEQETEADHFTLYRVLRGLARAYR